MPWRGAREAGEFPSLGYEVADWIESNLVVPDGPFMYQPFILSDWQLKFLLWFYRLHPDSEVEMRRPSRAFAFDRGGQIVMPQKAGKGPFSAAIAACEAAGPALFAGWNARGEPVGRAWPSAWVEITAVSEDQAGNVWRALLPMIREGPIAAEIPDTGETRINLPGGGTIKTVTASPKSRLGGRLTFCVQDETHSWTRGNRGRALADNQRRNLAGMGGRFLETSNAWDPTEASVAQETFEKGTGVHKFMVTCGPGSVRDKRTRRKLLKQVYQGSEWVDIDRVSSEVDELLALGNPAQAERYFLNRVVPAEDRCLDPSIWESASDPSYQVAPGALVTVGVDGARYRDSVAIIATEVSSGHQWPLGIWERPSNAGDDYEHPMAEVDGAMVDAFERFEVWRAYVDPGFASANIEALVQGWQGRWGEKRVVAWLMNRLRPAALMVRGYVAAIEAGDVTHNGDATFARHMGNARRRPVSALDDEGRPLWSVTKESPYSTASVDAFAAAALSWEARGDAIGAGATNAAKQSAYADRVCKCSNGPRGDRPHLRRDGCIAA